MSIKDQHDLAGLLKIGQVVGLALREMSAQVRAGMTTGELDAVGKAVLDQYGARPAPALLYNFPGAACISLNDEAAHGIPGARVIRAGDLVKLDMSAELDGFFADAAVTVAAPPVPPARQKLMDAARAALDAVLGAARAGAPLNRLGAAAEQAARQRGCMIIRELCGHGIGRALHEEPREVLSFYAPHDRRPLTEGLVLALEPHLTLGSGQIVTGADGWTLRTKDGRPAANYEHTVVITQGRPLLVTAV